MIKSWTAVASIALLLCACGQKIDPSAKDSPIQADASPVAPPPAPPVKAADFVPRAAMGDLFEVEAGKLAQQRGTDAQVKAFATMMVEEHAKSSEQLKQAVTASGVVTTLPASLDAEAKAKLDALTAADSAAFDGAYLDSQVEAHRTALELMQRYANNGDTPALTTFAGATAPVVAAHYERVKSLRQAIGAAMPAPAPSPPVPAAK